MRVWLLLLLPVVPCAVVLVVVAFVVAFVAVIVVCVALEEKPVAS